MERETEGERVRERGREREREREHRGEGKLILIRILQAPIDKDGMESEGESGGCALTPCLSPPCGRCAAD